MHHNYIKIYTPFTSYLNNLYTNKIIAIYLLFKNIHYYVMTFKNKQNIEKHIYYTLLTI